MILELKVNDSKKTPVPRWEKIQLPNRIVFNSGVNLLVGPNGRGKSTVLEMLARFFHCYQGGKPVVTQNSVSDLFEKVTFKGKAKEVFEAVQITHDGSPVFHYTPELKPGLIGGMAEFDYDFMEDGLRNCMSKASSGQTTYGGLSRILCMKKEECKINYKITEKGVNDIWANRIKLIRRFLEGNFPSLNIPTILLDEPERALDYKKHLELAKVIGLMAEKKGVQVIIATHSPLIMQTNGANLIELEDGYVDACRKIQERQLTKKSLTSNSE